MIFAVCTRDGYQRGDLVCYWFEKARAMIEQGKAKRAGLLATKSIRVERIAQVLDRIKQSGDIFWRRVDRTWILEGAAVQCVNGRF